jgi:peptidoglycan/xylan/chitin deacetylase (PgdA/CDA1 family)
VNALVTEKNVQDNRNYAPASNVDPKRPTEATRETVVGAIFRRGAHREIHDLLRAFVRTQNNHASLTLVISAGAEESEAVRRLAFELGILERVQLVGNQLNVPAFLSEFHIFALPVYEDVVPVALLEAMAAGKPVVTTGGSRLRKIISNGINGYLIPEGDTESLASALTLLSRKPALREAIGAEAQAYAKRVYRGSLFSGRQAYGYKRERPPSMQRRVLKNLLLATIPSKALFWHVVTNGDRFALTFDDGPDPIYTPRILDVLHSYSMAATFFLVGNRAEENLDIVRRMVAEGHEIANHSYTHPALAHCSVSVACDEVRHAEDVLRPFRKSERKFFRPPFGHVTPQSLIASWSEGYRVAMWSVDLKDYYATTTKEILAPLSLRPIVRGDIVLYHGTNPVALAALPSVLLSAIANGLTSVRLSELVD